MSRSRLSSSSSPVLKNTGLSHSERNEVKRRTEHCELAEGNLLLISNIIRLVVIIYSENLILQIIQKSGRDLYIFKAYQVNVIGIMKFFALRDIIISVNIIEI